MNIIGAQQIPQLPKSSLKRIEKWISKLDGREVTPERSCSPLTEEQILLRKIGREISRHDPPPPLNADTIEITDIVLELNVSPTSAHFSAPLTQEEIDCIDRSLLKGHQMAMNSLALVMKQIEIMRSFTESD